jgi:hypothetical protein
MTDQTQFDYLLNAFERASQSDKPADLDYAGKRKALYAYVRGLEGKDQHAQQAVESERDRALDFNDALRIARGCTDYGGGYRSSQEQFEIYQHGIQTVINALTAASKRGLADTQVRTLHGMGTAESQQPAQADKEK